LDAGAYADDESRSSGDGEDGVELFGEEDEETDEDEDEDEDEETQATRRLLAEEIRDLEAAIEKKIAEIRTVQNVLIKVCIIYSSTQCERDKSQTDLQRRFEEALRKLRADLDSRLLQRQQMSELRIAQDQARAQIERDSINVGSSAPQAGHGDGDVVIDEDEEEDAEDEADDEADVEELQKDTVSPEVGSEGPGQFVQR
jgi:transcription initiation factor TFIID subunit 7